MSNCNLCYRVAIAGSPEGVYSLQKGETNSWFYPNGDAVTDQTVIDAIVDLVDSDTNGLLRVECKDSKTPSCVESQEWTYGIDNTGTTFADTATYQITLSDGSTLLFDQTPTSSWTPQLQMWSANIQAAADAAGLAWFVEPRAVNNPNPTDISGTYGSTPTGLSGAPSIAIAQGLIDGGMAARYVNIQICPSQAVPVKAERLTSATYTNNPYLLNTAGAILGPLAKFYVCQDCGLEPVWYLADGVTKASAGQIPNCYEPCGTLALTDSPPEKDCTFQTLIGCDSNNSTLTTDFIPDITRRATICNGQQIGVDYFQADPNDVSALIPYTLIDRFVDCATGEEPPLPVVPCEEFEIVKLFRSPTNADGVFTSREWHDTAPAIALTTGIRTAEGAAFRENHDFSLPVDTQGTQNSFVLNDTNNTASELDIQVVDGYIYVTEPTYIRYTSTSEGYAAIELGECCGTLELKSEYGAFGYETPSVLLPVGGHQIRLWNIDSAGSNSSLTLQYSYDEVTWVSDNTPPNITISSTPLKEECVTVRICEDNLAAFDVLTGESIDLSVMYSCSVSCQVSGGSDLSDYDSCSGNIWTLFSKYEIADQSQYVDIVQVGDVTGGTHPTEGYDIDGWNVFTICSDTQPVTDNNGHVWLSGAPDSFTTPVWTRINPDSDCEGGKSLATTICNTNDITNPIVEAIENQSSGGSSCEDVDTPLTTVTGVNNNVPAGFKSVTIDNLGGTTTINGSFQLGAGRRVGSISFSTDRGNCVNELLPAYTLAGGTWQWIGHRE